MSKDHAMKVAKVRWVGAEQFIAVGPSGHAVPLDANRESNTAPGPMELLLLALGACTATDVVEILKKKRQKLDALEVEVSGERAKEPPTVWIKLELVYRLRGKLDDKAVRDAIQLSEDKYCSVAATLRKTAPITFRYEIQP
jgi:putative redox protein